MFRREIVGPPMVTVYSLHDVFFSADASRQYLLDKNVYYREISCKRCGEVMNREEKREKFRCGSRRCRAECSLRVHTFFYGSMLKTNQILLLGKLWLDKVSISSAISLTGHSPNTVVSFYTHFRALVASTLVDEDQTVGGPGIIVEVDETKLGKRKYHRGHRVEGVWVLVGVERTEERRMFAFPVELRNAETLQDIIVRFVRSGSVIHTDMWKGYSWIHSDSNYEHATVNHSIGFKDYETGVHTNYVEGTNNGLKTRIPVRSRVRGGIEDHLLEFVWRRKHENADLWESFMDAIREIHYDLE
jgi:hypothetical protein